VSSNTERRLALATKSATAESLLAGSTVTWAWRCGGIAEDSSVLSRGDLATA
jgi:hypothetical protein